MSRSGGNPERWARIDELYHAALERPESERDTFLRQACSGDEQLLQEVLSLLRFDANEEFLQRNPVEIAMGLQPGQVISHYRIIEKIGEGGMGVVYKAEDINLERTVALKFLAPHAIEKPDSKTRFFREAKAAAALDHPNVCTVFEVGEAEGRVFLAMAFVEGDRVADRIAKGPLKLGEAH